MAALIKEGDYAVHACEDGAMQLISLNRKRTRMTDAPKSDVAETLVNVPFAYSDLKGFPVLTS